MVEISELAIIIAIMKNVEESIDDPKERWEALKDRLKHLKEQTTIVRKT